MATVASGVRYIPSANTNRPIELNKVDAENILILPLAEY